MEPTLYSASAPGTLMLLGEHAVLHNKRAMVCAINKRIKVTLKPRLDKRVIICSALCNIEISLDKLEIKKPFQFVLAAVKSVAKDLQSGFELSIVSEFPEDVGFGSSAAVTVATLRVLYQFMASSTHLKIQTMGNDSLFKAARNIIQGVQGVGSGADVAACIYGGILVYQQNPPFVLDKFSNQPPLVAVYSGNKTPTPEVIKKVEEGRKAEPHLFEEIYTAIDRCVEKGADAVQNKNWTRLGSIFNIQQGLMNAIGVTTPLLNRLIDALKTEPTIQGAKISGAGLGDCIIGVGASSPLENGDAETLGLSKMLKMLETLGTGVRSIPVAVSVQGVSVE